MPETVKGNNVFRQSQGILGMDTYVDLNQSQEWDDILPDDDEPSQPSQEGPHSSDAPSSDVPVVDQPENNVAGTDQIVRFIHSFHL